MLAATVVAGDANRPARAVHDDDGVEAIGLARSADIFDGIAGPERTIHHSIVVRKWPARENLRGRSCSVASLESRRCYVTDTRGSDAESADDDSVIGMKFWLRILLASIAWALLVWTAIAMMPPH